MKNNTIPPLNQRKLTNSMNSSGLRELKSDQDLSSSLTKLSLFKPQSASLHRPPAQHVTRGDSFKSLPRPKTSTHLSKSTITNVSATLPLTSRISPSQTPKSPNHHVPNISFAQARTSSSADDFPRKTQKPPLIINVYPSLPNRFTYESDDLAHFLTVLKSCKPPLYPITQHEQEKRKQVYSTLAFIMSAFQYHDKIVHASVEPDEHSIQNVSYGHPQDLFQVCCYLLRENLSYTSEIDNLKSQILEKDRKIEEFHKKYESTNDHDLVKHQPSENDLKHLEESVSKLEDDIYHHDPILYKEIMEKTEEEELLHNLTNAEGSKEFFNTKDSIPRLPAVIRNAEAKRNATRRGITPYEEMDHAQKYTQCLQYKMRLLENLIFVLKKKIQRYEQSDSEVKQLVKQWGSLPELLRENEAMKKELNFYNWVTQRFDTELLLKHKYLYLDDVYMLRSVIFALQNELFVAQQGLAKYNDVENKLLKIMTTKSAEKNASKHFSLEYLMTDLFMTEKQKYEYEKKKEAKRMVAEENNKSIVKDEDQEPSVMDLRNKIRTLEHENKFLSNQLGRLEQQVTDLTSAMELLNEEVTGERKVEIKERETMIRKLTSRIDHLNKATTDREVYFLFQQNLVQELTDKRDKLFAENALTNEKLINTRNEVVELTQKLRHQANGLQVMYQITSSLLFYFIKTTTGKEIDSNLSPKNNVKIMFQDVFTSYIFKMNASVKLQSWFRGILTRKRLLKSQKHSNFVSRMLKKRKFIAFNHEREKALRSEEPPLFSVFGDFLKVISSFSNESSDMLKQTEGIIQAFKEEITERFKSKIEQELASFKEEQLQYSEQLMAALKAVVLKPKGERSCQTETIQRKSRGIQHGVAQVTNVELRK
ncbi:hypothetical protein C9374_014103 [Naegleria lovaniensis]|uniref:Uncharacterized protein n=1 Tax=Naegleria lovaniensis TaxID=51637 RepID=A0AA88KPK8_NAELO|nr:uncharacterized protein C9374_014103 [Naegleria lovaniensis]KAG2389543.1 hypothetical protein C9374_014103 [Naegleria lovaniensis]